MKKPLKKATLNLDALTVLFLLLSLKMFSTVVNFSVIEPLLTLLLLAFSVTLLVLKKLKVKRRELLFTSFILVTLCNGLFFAFVEGYFVLEPFRSFIRWATIFSLCLVPRVYDLNTDKCVRLVFLWIVLPGLFLILYSIYTGGYKEYQGQFRLTEPFTNPNSLALFSFFSIFIVICELVKGKKGWLHYYIIGGVYFYALVKSGGMTSTLVTLIFIILCSYFYLPSYKKLISLSLGALFVCVLVFYNIDSIFERLNGVIFSDISTMELSEGSSIYWRLKAWRIYIDSMTGVDYIFGHGLGVSRFLLLPDHKFSSMNGGFVAPGTHNDYLQLLVDFGIFGGLIFFVVYLSMLKKVAIFFSVDKVSIILFSFLLSLMIFMVMDNVIDSKFFFVIALLWSSFVHRGIRRDSERS